MKIGEDIIEHIKSYVIEELLDEEGYDYYIDEVALAIDPTVVHVFLYSNAPAEVVKYLAKNGLAFSDNVDSYQTMSYRSMLYISLITSRERYEMLENENCKIETISLYNIVEWAKGRGCNREEIINILRRATLCTS